jgi:hypothetical protein
MKFSLKLANGATLDFEGDSTEFERVSEFLVEPPESLTSGTVEAEQPDGQSHHGGGEGSPLDPGNVSAEIEQLGARNDQERVTVMAQLAVDAGKEGIDFETLNSLYTELALKKPANFPTKTLSNAKYSGLMKMVSPGVWRPTYKGENFAKGHGRGNSAAPRRTRPKSSANAGGESD